MLKDLEIQRSKHYKRQDTVQKDKVLKETLNDRL